MINSEFKVNEELDIARALHNGWHGSMWRLVDNDYEQLVWLDEEKPAPSLEELKEADKLAIIEEKKKLYLLNRGQNYPSIQDQLDMMYWDKMNGTSVWQDKITMIKMNHPKGNADG